MAIDWVLMVVGVCLDWDWVSLFFGRVGTFRLWSWLLLTLPGRSSCQPYFIYWWQLCLDLDYCLDSSLYKFGVLFDVLSTAWCQCGCWCCWRVAGRILDVGWWWFELLPKKPSLTTIWKVWIESWGNWEDWSWSPNLEWVCFLLCVWHSSQNIT